MEHHAWWRLAPLFAVILAVWLGYAMLAVVVVDGTIAMLAFGVLVAAGLFSGSLTARMVLGPHGYRGSLWRPVQFGHPWTGMVGPVSFTLAMLEGRHPRSVLAQTYQALGEAPDHVAASLLPVRRAGWIVAGGAMFTVLALPLAPALQVSLAWVTAASGAFISMGWAVLQLRQCEGAVRILDATGRLPQA